MTDRYAQPPDEGNTDAEGVRIIGAEEAQEAIERGEVAPRLADQEPRPGDRYGPPPGSRPTIRFPLSGSESPHDVDRPPLASPAAPGQPPEDGGESEAAAWSAGAGGGWGEEGEQASGFEPAAGYGDEPAWGGEDAGWDTTSAEPVPPGPAELPHWTEPPTGEVPKVIASDEGDDLEAWSSFAASPPRWRDEHHDWSEGDYDDMSALGDEGSRVGALDPTKLEPIEDPFAALDDEHAVVGGPDLFDDSTATVRRERPARRPLRRHGGGEGQGGGHGRDVQTAAVVGAGLGLAALILIGIAPPKIGILAVTVATAVAAWEFFSATLQGGARAAVPVGLIAATGLPLAVYWRPTEAVALVVVLSLITALAWYVVGAGGNAPVLEGVGTTLLGVVWIGVFASYAARFLPVHQGRSMLIAIIVVVVAADVGAFFGGQSFGRTPLSHVSPNKTREGAVIGLIAAAVMGVVVGILKVGVFSSAGNGLLLGLVIGIVSPVGDLCESVIKRDLGVKDMGSLLPGHGGLLDRIDGLLFALPAAYYLIVAFHFHY